MSANSSTRKGPSPECIQVYYTGTSQLKAGDALCYDHDATDTSVQNYNVEDPSLNNAGHFAGIVADGQTAANLLGPCLVNIEVITNVPAITTVRSNLSITAGDLLAPIPGSRNWAKWCGVGRPLAQAMETVDRSTTAGRVRVRYGNLNLSDSVLANKATRFFDDFLGFGDPVAAVFAETLDQARDAAEAIAIEWEALPTVTVIVAAFDSSLILPLSVSAGVQLVPVLRSTSAL